MSDGKGQGQGQGEENLSLVTQLFSLLPDPARQLVKWVLGFGVGVGFGMALFLGARRIPGFEPLLSLVPRVTSLLPVSNVLVGLVAIGVQYYSGVKIAQKYLFRLVGIGLIVLACGLVGLIFLNTYYVVPIGKSEAVVLVGWSRSADPGCKCGPNVSDSQCVAWLGQYLGSCWKESSVRQVEFCFYLTYLFVIGGFTALIGLLVLQETERARRKAEKEAKELAEKAAKELAEKKKQAAREKRESKRQAQPTKSNTPRAAPPADEETPEP